MSLILMNGSSVVSRPKIRTTFPIWVPIADGVQESAGDVKVASEDRAMARALKELGRLGQAATGGAAEWAKSLPASYRPMFVIA